MVPEVFIARYGRTFGAATQDGVRRSSKSHRKVFDSSIFSVDGKAVSFFNHGI